MEKIFKLKEHGTDVRTEVTAGLTTFFGLHLARGLSNGLSMWCYFINHHGNEST